MSQMIYSDPRSRAKKPMQRNKALGQVFTPEDIAAEMACTMMRDRQEGPVTILDPCVGPCTFPRALLRNGLLHVDDNLVVVDMDEQMVDATRAYLGRANVFASYQNCDYLTLRFGNNFDYAILNPPYIRQEWIENKEKLRTFFRDTYGLEVPGTSNLYAYFLVKVIQDLKPGGRFSCIIYDSWQFTKFGQWLVEFMNGECSELALRRVGNQPFEGRIIDATILYGTKRNMAAGETSASGDLVNIARPGYASGNHGFAIIENLFNTKRGLRLKQVDFFMCSQAEGASVGAVPFVKKVNAVKGFAVAPDHPEAALILKKGDVNIPMMAVLKDRIRLAAKAPEENVSILTWHKERPGAWCFHNPPPPAPLIFNYYMRNRPKHILNDRCYSDNFYGLIPHHGNPLAWLAILNSTAVCVETLTHSRTQGSGLSKIQLYEYRNVSVPDLKSFSESEAQLLEGFGRKLASGGECEDNAVLAEIDNFIYMKFNDEKLRPAVLADVLQSLQSR